ncbi:hypothetical protein [Acidithiobacillus ferrivorans]|uniref:hypothetical protein n=1 Tax=Acidithiobacillus ferrivorans TaxID=160808 RepID=UPI00117892A3|nr:hypothetical protein [Acidithiobacillus ferrivorans]
MNTNSATKEKLLLPLLFFLLYVLIDVLYFHPFDHNLKQTIFLPGSDAESFIWFIYWWPYAIMHDLNPFITHYIWSPGGVNLTWATSIPTLSLITAPLTIMFGPVFSWNLLSLLAAPLNAFCAFVLLKYLYKNNAAAFLGGYVFGYSSYVIGQLFGGHLNLDFICLIPLSILLFIMHTNKDINKYYFVIIMALIIFLEAGISTEVLATATLFGFVSIMLFFVFEKGSRSKLIVSSLCLLSSYVIAAVFLAPFLYFLINGFDGAPKFVASPSTYSSDLLNYVIPTPITRIGRTVFASIYSRFTGNYAEEGAYIGVPLLLLFALSLIDKIVENRRTGFALLVIFVMVIVFSFGPFIHVNGVNTHIKMPWSFFKQAPLIGKALPTRFTNYASLIVAITIGFWLSTEAATKKRYVAVIASIMFIVPNTSIYNWGAPSVPSIFTKHNILKNNNVIVLPFGYTGPSMFWQLESGMAFNMVGGYVGLAPLPFRKMQVTSALLYGAPGSHFHDLFKAYCEQFNVTYVVACSGTPAPLVQSLKKEGWTTDKYGQCTVYHVHKI